MNFLFHLRLLSGAALPTALTLAFACGGTTALRESPVGSDASGPDAATSPTSPANPTSPVVSCPSPADGGLYGAQNPASGTLSGPDLQATVCNVAASVFVESYLSSPTLAYLDLENGEVLLTRPSGASTPTLSLMLQIPAAAPGTYKSSDQPFCASGVISYELPLPPGVDCGDGGIVGPTCPAGCAAACSGFGCTACAPNAPEGAYLVRGGATCFGVTETQVGSWTITLTSVEPFTGDAGAAQGRQNFTVRGRIDAVLEGGDPDAGTEPVTLSLSF